jgi:hypothetical protein
LNRHKSSGARWIAAVCLLVGPCLQAASLSGAVKDPSGAVVSGAAVAAQPLPRGTLLQTTTDSQGRFHFDGAAAGAYTVTVAAGGFEPWQRQVTLAAKPVDLAISLKLAIVTTTVKVSARRSPLANSDPNYQSLRGGKLTKVYRVENLTLKRDVGTFTFRSGSFSFLPPVLGRVTTGVFVGDAEFTLEPAFEIATKHLHRIAGVDSVDEEFSAMVVYFTDATFDEVSRHSELADESPKLHEEAFKRVKETLESRREPPSPLMRGGRPLTFLERILNFEDIPNIEAELLAELYNPLQGGSYRAFIHGKKHSDLRFLLNPRGALPVLPAPEETALLNFDPNGETDGIWYLSHLAAELRSKQASSNEDKRLIAPEHYKMEILLGRDSILGNSAGLAATADLRFHALEDGVRVVKFDLLPDFQVARVSWNGKDIPFIQENRKQDGSFYLEMPEPLAKGRTCQVTFEYSGGDIVRGIFDAPRSLWYPRVAGAISRATYDLVFHVPHGSHVVSVGKQVKESKDAGSDISEWSSDLPIPVATFKYFPDYFAKTRVDEVTNTELGVYIDSGGRGFLPPSRDDILIDAGNAVRVFNAWFGPPSYSSLSVLVGRATDSLPGLVYANPIALAGFSSLYTQSVVNSMGRGGRGGGGGGGRGGGNGGAVPATMRSFLDEAFSREVSRQWWGNTVGSVSFHDEWLSRGFANFSTSLYDLAAYMKPDEFLEHWDKAREALLHPPRFFLSAVRPNDTGPIWMGLLNDTYKTPGAGNIVSTSKGGFVLHMLRGLMFDQSGGDKDFRAMMQDYVKTFANRSVSTEEFKWLVEKHMKSAMDLDGNRRMDWFFLEWVYGTDIPSYRLEYSIAAADRGSQPVVTGKLTQSGVSPTFKMRVPIYGEFEKRKLRIGSVAIAGNATIEFKVHVPEVPKRILLNVTHDVLTDKEEVKQVK